MQLHSHTSKADTYSQKQRLLSPDSDIQRISGSAVKDDGRRYATNMIYNGHVGGPSTKSSVKSTAVSLYNSTFCLQLYEPISSDPITKSHSDAHILKVCVCVCVCVCAFGV